MIQDPNKRYPGQPGFFSEPPLFSFRTIPVIDTQHPALYGCFITMNGYMVAMTPNGTREECEIMGFNGMQAVAADYEKDKRR